MSSKTHRAAAQPRPTPAPNPVGRRPVESQHRKPPRALANELRDVERTLAAEPEVPADVLPSRVIRRLRLEGAARALLWAISRTAKRPTELYRAPTP